MRWSNGKRESAYASSSDSAAALLVRAFVWPFLRQVARQDQAIIEEQPSLRQYFPGRHAAVTSLDIARPYIARA